MRTAERSLKYAVALGVVLLLDARATLIPRLSFEQLTDGSDLIVSGRVTRTWGAWDPAHKYIWTHYEFSVSSALKGSPSRVVEFAEPGGAVDGRVMNIAGAPAYAVGDRMVLFLFRMPNGYLRTGGWGQGKYALDAGGHIHATMSPGAETVDEKGAAAGTSLRTLDGIALGELSRRVAARVRATGGHVP